jgi:hypothetical protein
MGPTLRPNTDPMLLFKEFLFIGDGIINYFVYMGNKNKNNKNNFGENLPLYQIYNNIFDDENTFTCKKYILSMGQREFNESNLPYHVIYKELHKIVDLLCSRGASEIILLFPILKPKFHKQKPVTLDRYITYKRMFAKLAEDDRVTVWRKPSLIFEKCELVNPYKGQPYWRPKVDENSCLIPCHEKFIYDSKSMKFMRN